MNEFDIIKSFFATQIKKRKDVIVGIGDDAALIKPERGKELAITTDTLVENVHFLAQTLPFDIGYKALAVNLSDLAAMGATPAFITLALTMPHANEDWLRDFSRGFFSLANSFSVELIGGDLTRGPLSITMQAIGYAKEGEALLRSRAMPADCIYVTGSLGDAGLALHALLNKKTINPIFENYLLERLNRPHPQVKAGECLGGIASAAIDISDGLIADLSHILHLSKVGAKINVDHIPLSDALKSEVPKEEALKFALTAGDDYELCFTVPKEKQELLEKSFTKLNLSFTPIGEITANTGLLLHSENGYKYESSLTGFQHF